MTRPPKVNPATGHGIVLCVLAMLAGNVQADDTDRRGWYAGVAAGVSRLAPDTEGSSLEVEEEISPAGSLWLGRDLTDRFSAELAIAELGEATLTGDNTIGYRALSLGAVAHLLGDSAAIARRSGPSLYLRGGLSMIENESELDLETADNTALWAGVGFDWPFGRIGVRGEVASYDGDAQAAWLGVYGRLSAATAPGRSTRERPSASSDPAPRQPAPVTAPTPAPQAEQRPTPAPTRQPDIAPRAPARVPAPAPVNACERAVGAEPADANGCAVFAGALAGVDFLEDTARLTPVAERLLVRLATQLNAYPNAVVEIQAHTASMLTPAAAKALAKQRAVAVARSLAGAGVDVSRLRARAFGDTRPRAAGSDAGARRLNNRIELDVLN